MAQNWFLIGGGAASFVAAALHVAVIAGGPAWYRFFGAGEGFARAAERGSWMPALATSAIAAVLAIWGIYAFAGAGLLPRLPLMRIALVAITAVFLLRAVWIVPGLPLYGRSQEFAFWSSLIVLVIGALYAVGTWQAWRQL